MYNAYNFLELVCNSFASCGTVNVSQSYLIFHHLILSNVYGYPITQN